MIKKLIGLFSFLTLAFLARGQDLSYKQYSTEDGLPSDGVYDVVQDSLGYLWFSTTLGLSRFDGERFVNFDATNGLAETENFVFFKEGNKRLWVVGPNCLISYVENGKVYPYEFNYVIQDSFYTPSLPANIWVDENESLHFTSTANGEVIVDKEGNFFGEKDFVVRDTIQLKERLYLKDVGGNSLIRFLWKNPKRLRPPVSDSTILEFDGYSYSYTDNSFQLNTSNIIWDPERVLVQRKLKEILLFSKGKVKSLGKMSHRIVQLQKHEGHLFVSTFGGLFEYEFANGKLKLLKSYLKNKIVTSCFVDVNKGLWATTHNSGVYYFPNRNVRIFNEDNLLFFNNIRRIGLSEDNSIITAGFGGNLAFYPNSAPPKDLSGIVPNSQDFRAVIAVEDDQFLLSTGQRFMWKFNKQKPTKVFLSSPLNEINTFWGGIHEGDSTIVCGSDGLYVYKNEKLFELYPHEYERRWTVSVERLSDNTLLVGTKKGVFNYSILGKSMSRRFHEGALSKVRVDNIKKMNNGSIIYGTRGDGIFIQNEKGLQNIKKVDGLASNHINVIQVEGRNILLGTNNGLSILKESPTEKNKYSIKNYSINDGLSSNNIQDINISYSKIYLATSRGISIIEAFFDEEFPAKLILERLIINGTPRSLNECKTLDHGQNNLEFDIAAISLFSQGNIVYHYMLEGIDQQWRTSLAKEINYNNLPPGKYRFLLKSENSKGVINEEPLIWEFEITPPFWKTWWFIVSGISAILLIAFLIFRYQIEQYRRKSIQEESIEKEKAQLELQALRSQMNPHFLFNSLNSIQYFFSTADNKKAQGYLASFAKLMRNILDSSSRTEVLLKEEIESLRLYLRLEQMRFSENLDYEIKLNGLESVDKIFIPPMVVQPFIENAIIHGLERGGRDGKITVEFKSKDGNLICHVEDNGIGREAAQKKGMKKSHKSVGMLLSRRRMEILNRDSISGGEIKVTDLVDPEGNAIGTRVSIYFGNISKLVRI